MSDRPQIFSEIYGVHYRLVDYLIKHPSRNLKESLHQGIIDCLGDEDIELESEVLNKIDKEWHLFDSKSGESVLLNAPEIPLTTLEKQFMKTALLDPRVRLFDLDGECKKLADSFTEEPLYNPKDIVYYDRYADGDPYEDQNYINHFQAILKAMHDFSPVEIDFKNRNGDVKSITGDPLTLIYSQRDDKFRIQMTKGESPYTILISSIIRVRQSDDYSEINDLIREPCKASLKVKDEKEALERAAMSFSHYEKKVTQLSEEPSVFRIEFDYNPDEELDIAIRVISFGPNMIVEGPGSLRKNIINRLKEQATLFENYGEFLDK